VIDEGRRALVVRAILLALLACIVLGDAFLPRASWPGGHAYIAYLVSLLYFWPIPWAYMMLITPMRAWSTLWTLSVIFLGWPAAYVAAQWVTCDPNPAIGLATGIMLMVYFVAAGLLEYPTALLIAFGIFTIIAALSVALHKLLWRRWFAKWVVAGAFLSVPIVLTAVAIYLVAHGARWQLGNCTIR
jgi:hypothetical protein